MYRSSLAGPADVHAQAEHRRCRSQALAAKFLVAKGYTNRYDYALATLREIPYGKWREYDAEDTVRFYALRLREVGMIRNSPQQIIARGTNWRFLRELKQELTSR